MRQRAHHPPTRHRGMTLIELLVVVAIMLTLVITVAPNMVNTAEARRSREAARMVSGMVAKAQSRAIGRTEWSGLMLMAVGGNSLAAIDIVLADVPAAYRGDTDDATVQVTGSVGSSRIATPVPSTALASLVMASVAAGDLIRFDGRGPLFELGDAKTSGFDFELQGHEAKAVEHFGYEPHNTPWPAPAPVRHTFEIFRRPTPAGSPLSLPGNRIVDLLWSGVGPPQVDVIPDTYRQFGRSGPVSAVSLVFDGTGRLRQALVGSARLTITGPVFLLVGRADRAGQASAPLNPDDDAVGANWQYPDSWWVAIDPMTGVAKAAECFPGAASVTDSQRWIRDALLASGR